MCSILAEFNKTRETKINELMETCEITRGQAKAIIINIMYLGSLTNACIDAGCACPPPDWADELALHFIQICDMINAINTDISKKVSKCKKFKNKKATCLSYVLQIIEDDIIMNAMNKLIKLDYNVETLCFDGLLIEKKEINQGVLDDLNAYCFNKTGYNVKFEIKPMNDCLDLQTSMEFDFSDYPFKHTQKYDQLYCSQLQHETEYGTYELRKEYIQKFFCKIQVPDSCFIYECGSNWGEDKVPEPYVYSSKSLQCLFKCIQSGMYNSSGFPISFFDQWTSDPKTRTYSKYDFIPFSKENDLINPEVYNMFLGFNEAVYTKPNLKQEGLKVWFDLVKALCGDCEGYDDYFHAFIANMFQEPANRPPVAILIKGPQGVGKNMILDTLGHMVGKAHYTSSSDPKDFFGDHAEGFYRKLLVNLNETEGRDTFQFEGKIKSFITEPDIIVNAKFVRPCKVSNHARVVITTNKSTPISLDVRAGGGERRWVVYEASKRFLQYNGRTWTEIYNHFRTSKFLATLYKYYMELDISNIDWKRNRPITKAYKDLCNLFSPIEALFLENYIEEKTWEDVPEFEDIKEINGYLCVPVMSLFESYNKFCKINKFGKENINISSKSFSGKLASLNLPMEKKRISHGATCWCFKQTEVINYMTNEKWIGDYGVDEGNSISAEEGVSLNYNMFD